MSFQMYKDEFQELFYNAIKKENVCDEINKSIPKEIGTGHAYVRTLNNTLFIEQNFHFNDDIIVHDTESHNNGEYCFLSLVLEGDNCLITKNKKQKFNFRKNSVHLGVGKEDKTQLDIKKGLTKQYSFVFSQDILIEYLREFDDIHLINQVENTQGFNLFKQVELSTSHHFLIDKMLKNPYHGSLRNLYFELCANELMITLLKDLSAKKVYTPLLKEEDKVRLFKAKKLLLEDIQYPPTIEELTKLTALNKEKLTKGFKILFDNTIFKTLTQQRMKIAYEELQKKDMNITEIAHKTGYLNVSNFIAVFRKQYGKTPGEMRKDRSFYWFEY